MTAAPFQPLGERSRREIVLDDVLRTLSPGEIATYEALAEALEVDPAEDRHIIQSAVRDAAREFLTVDRHAVEAVRGVGYRVVVAGEHVRIGQGQQRRSLKALERSHRVATHVRYEDLSPADRLIVEGFARVVSAQLDFNRATTHRLERQERATAAVTSKAERTEAEVAELRARLAALESIS